MTTSLLVQRGNWSIPMDACAEEKDLAIRLARGEDAALHELFEQYGNRLYAYALQLTSDPDKAEDILQEALIAVWRSADRYRGEGRFIAWLLGIVHHKSMDAMRRPANPITAEMEEKLADHTSSPESQTQQNQQGEWVRQGLAELSLEHRAVLELMFYQKLSVEEIAQVCSCPVGTVKSRLAYARQHLKGILVRQNPEEWR